jgi:hypothetical protein
MLADLFVEHVWAAVLFVWALSFLDYRLSVIGVRLYKRGAHEHFDLGGSYELNPPFEDDVESERLVSPKHLFALARLGVVIVAVWWFTARAGRLEGVYIGTLGFFVLTQVPAHIRHVQNISLFRYVNECGGVTGKTHTPRWLDLRLSGILFWAFAAAYLLVWVVVGEPFFLGGVVGAALAGARFWIFGGDAEKERDPA